MKTIKEAVQYPNNHYCHHVMLEPVYNGAIAASSANGYVKYKQWRPNRLFIPETSYEGQQTDLEMIIFTFKI